MILQYNIEYYSQWNFHIDHHRKVDTTHNWPEYDEYNSGFYSNNNYQKNKEIFHVNAYVEETWQIFLIYRLILKVWLLQQTLKWFT